MTAPRERAPAQLLPRTTLLSATIVRALLALLLGASSAIPAQDGVLRPADGENPAILAPHAYDPADAPPFEIPRAAWLPVIDGVTATGEWDDAAEALLLPPPSLVAPKSLPPPLKRPSATRHDDPWDRDRFRREDETVTVEFDFGQLAGVRKEAAHDQVALRAKWDDEYLYLALKGVEPPSPEQDALARYLGGEKDLERPAATERLVAPFVIRIDPRPQDAVARATPRLPGGFVLELIPAWMRTGDHMSVVSRRSSASYAGAELPRSREAEGWSPLGLRWGAIADPGLCIELAIPLRELNSGFGTIAGGDRVRSLARGNLLDREHPPKAGDLWLMSVERFYTNTLAARWGTLHAVAGTQYPLRRVRFGAAPVPGWQDASALVPWELASRPMVDPATNASGTGTSVASSTNEPTASWPPEGFSSNFADAVRRAGRERRMILLLYSSPSMEESRPGPYPWRLAPLRDLCARTVPVVLDPWTPQLGAPSPDPQELPAVVLLSPAGREAGRVVGKVSARELQSRLTDIMRRVANDQGRVPE